MKEQEIIKLFLGHGFQITKETLPLVSENTKDIINKLEKLTPRPFIITKKHIGLISSSRQKEKKPITVDDYMQYLQSNYEKSKEIILEKNKLDSLLSINKIDENTDNFSLIVLIRKKNKNNLLVEDLTGEINISFNENLSEKINNIDIDSIIGIKCKQENFKVEIVNIVCSAPPINFESFIK